MQVLTKPGSDQPLKLTKIINDKETGLQGLIQSGVIQVSDFRLS